MSSEIVWCRELESWRVGDLEELQRSKAVGEVDKPISR
jgi:hypothetical protein